MSLEIRHRALTISGYEKRLIRYYKKYYNAGIRYGIKLSYLQEMWESNDVGKVRAQTAIRRLCKRGIIQRPIIDGQTCKGSYIFNPNYVPKSQK